MADSFVQVAPDSTGKEIQCYQNTVNSQVVQSQAVVLVNTSSVPITTLPTFASVDGTSTYAPTNATSTAYEASRVVKASAGVLFSITGYNNGSGQFILVMNASSLPADGTAPVIVFTVPKQSNFSLDFGGKFGRYFSTGIVVCNSSTGSTKTIGSANCWFDCQFA